MRLGVCVCVCVRTHARACAHMRGGACSIQGLSPLAHPGFGTLSHTPSPPSHTHSKYLVRVSYLQIYNEVISDLLKVCDPLYNCIVYTVCIGVHACV